MKKALTLILSLLSCSALLLSLGACNLDKMIDDAIKNATIEETSESSADNKEGSMELIEEFFKATLESGNFVATTTFEDDTRVESVVGDASCTVDSASGTTFWGFKRGEEFISAVSSEDGSHYYMTGENYYNTYYCYCMSTVRVVDYFTDEDGTFSCVVKTESKTSTADGEQVTESTSTLVFDFVTEGGTINITAHAKNDLVQDFTYTMHDNAENRSVTAVTIFTYGNAVVELPDISDWEDISFDYEGDEFDEEVDGEAEEG